MSSKLSYARKKPNTNLDYLQSPAVRSKIPKGKKEPFVSFFPSTLKSARFVSMTKNAQLLWIRMCLRCAEEDKVNRRECTFRKSEYVKQGYTPDTFKKAVTELIENGYIRKERFTARGSPCHYRMSQNWHKFTGIVPEDDRYY